MSFDRLNKYTCQKCGGYIITIDTDEGVTPFMLRCRATDKCDGMMHSSFYQCLPANATFEWRKPSAQEYRKMTPEMRDHVDQGGLDIYPIGDSVRSQPKVTSRTRYLDWKERFKVN